MRVYACNELMRCKLPQSPTKKGIPKHKLLVKHPGYLPGGPVGGILENIMQVYLPPGPQDSRWIPVPRFVGNPGILIKKPS